MYVQGLGRDISMEELENLPTSGYSLAELLGTVPGLTATGSKVPGSPVSVTLGFPSTPGITEWLNTNAKTLAILAGAGLAVVMFMRVTR